MKKSSIWKLLFSALTVFAVAVFAAIQYARSVGMAVHISTQSNISNIEAVRFFAQWADVVVLARELDLVQVARISREIEEPGQADHQRRHA